MAKFPDRVFTEWIAAAMHVDPDEIKEIVLKPREHHIIVKLRAKLIDETVHMTIVTKPIKEES